MAIASAVERWIAKGVYMVTWNLTGTVTRGRPVCLPTLPDKTVQVNGTFGGGTVVIEGANFSATDSTVNSLATTKWDTLNDTRGEGNAASFTAVNTVAIMENPNLMRVRFSAALASVVTPNVTVRMICQSTQR